MSILGEAVLTASVELLLSKLASSDLLTFARQEKLDADLKKWENTLMTIHAVLEDAEEKQLTNQSVKQWLVHLKNLAYDVEDILDEFETKALERKLVHTSCTNLNPRSFRFNVKMGSKITKITGRLQEIVALKNDLHLVVNSEGRSSNKVRDQRLPTTSLSEAHVYGREKDQEAIIELVLKDECNEDVFSVIPIVGMGGLGKTTLAQNVYNDSRVKNRFDLKAWACVSDDFDVIRVTRAILQSMSSSCRDSDDLNQLQVKLSECLSGKKFLIVLDDIWNENYGKWTALLRPFRVGFPGSKVIVTTRSDYISSMVGTLPTYSLKELSFDDCLSIFTHHSLGRKDFSQHKDLKEIGEKIVRKCKGLPLAVKTLAGLLRSKVNREDWEHVLNSKIWNLPEERSDIQPALRLSYYYLPPHLKRCFAYFSLLPKNYPFKKKEIVLLWMAEGLLVEENNDIQMEDLGDDYFSELQSRSLFQKSAWRYVMHDLIHDLAQWVAGEIFFFRLEEGSKQNDTSKNLRHLAFDSRMAYDIKKFTYNHGLHHFIHLRTLLPLWPKRFSKGDLFNILPKLRCLRYLYLQHYIIRELPDAIGDLKHLRYIDLSCTDIHVLPKSICRLYNLQTLILMACSNLKELCPDIGNLINLRYLDISSTKIESMPMNFGRLTSLRTLSNFFVGKGIGSGLEELKFLKHLQGDLRISGLENINDAMDAKEADLNGKRSLRKLVLEWSSCDLRKEDIETQVLEMLCPNEKLEELSISGFGGTVLPTWLGDTSFSNLVELCFENCSNCISLPSVGQLPSLKLLRMRNMGRIKRVGLEFFGNGCSKPFPSLQFLFIGDMDEWEEWITDGFDLEGLTELFIKNCPKLQGKLPEHLPSLKRLVIEGCEQLQVSTLTLPAGCSVAIDGCKQLQQGTFIAGLNALNPVLFDGISGYMFLINRYIQRSSEGDEMEVVGYKESTSFWHTSIKLERPTYSVLHCIGKHVNVGTLLDDLPNDQQGLPYRRQYLVLKDSLCLEKLPQALQSLSFLSKLCISNCTYVVSFPEVGLPSQLKIITIASCDALHSLPKSWMDSTSIVELHISSCNSLAYIASQLPPNLIRLSIDDCYNLQTLCQVEENNSQSSVSGNDFSLSMTESKLPDTLEFVHISGCSNLALFCSKSESTGGRGPPIGPTNLGTLILNGLQKLEALSNNMHQLKHLEILNCSSLVSFAEEGLSSTNLTTLCIGNCGKLEALPNRLHNLTSLRELRISDCPGIESFPEGGFPTGLTYLGISNLKFFESLFRWGLHKLTSLAELRISRWLDMVSFPPEERGIMLPTSLTSLTILNFPNLKRLSPVIQNLNSLERLSIWYCPKLKAFPKKGLPPSLSSLRIQECPLLKQKCRRAQYRKLIAHITDIDIK